jgi:hypothetical protein
MSLIIVVRFLFVALAILNLILDIKVLFKSKYEKYLEEAKKARAFFLVSKSNPTVSILLMLLFSLSYYFVGFWFIAKSSVVAMPQLLGFNVIGVIILAKVINLMLNHFCIEGIMKYGRDVFINDMLNVFIGLAVSLWFIIMISYQNIMMFLN